MQLPETGWKNERLAKRAVKVQSMFAFVTEKAKWRS